MRVQRHRLPIAFYLILVALLCVAILTIPYTPQSRIKDLQAELDAIKAGQHQPVDLSDLEGRVAELEQTIDVLNTAYWQCRNNVDGLYTIYEETQRRGVDEWQCPVSYAELELASRVVMAESGNQPYIGQMAVAQTILDRMQRDDQTLEEVVYAKNQFAAPYKGDVTDSVKAATEAIFLHGQRVCEEPLYFFYSTVGGFYSKMHESKAYVMTIDDHKFFN